MTMLKTITKPTKPSLSETKSNKLGEAVINAYNRQSGK